MLRMSKGEFTQTPPSVEVGSTGRCNSGGNTLATSGAGAMTKPYSSFTTSVRNSAEVSSRLVTPARPSVGSAATHVANSLALAVRPRSRV